MMNTSNTDRMPKSQRFQMDLISNLLEKFPGIVRLNFLDRRRFSLANQANRPRNLETVIDVCKLVFQRRRLLLTSQESPESLCRQSNEVLASTRPEGSALPILQSLFLQN